MNNQNITFDFILDNILDEKTRSFLWLGVHDEGIQTWNTLVGLNFKDAIIRSIYNNPCDYVVYDSLESVIENEFPKIDSSKPINLETVTKVAEKMIEYIENSEVDGDSSEQIIVFDITDLKNINMLYPER